MEEKAIKSGQQVIREFIAEIAKDQAVDTGTIGAIKSVLESERKISVTKLLRELERFRKE